MLELFFVELIHNSEARSVEEEVELFQLVLLGLVKAFLERLFIGVLGVESFDSSNLSMLFNFLDLQRVFCDGINLPCLHSCFHRFHWLQRLVFFLRCQFVLDVLSHTF